MYTALYRKWRPATFDDVVGQEHITRTLKNEVAAARLSHAYLFCGTRGTGKTSCAKILAKAVNCPDSTDGNPCGVCEICKGIDAGRVLDVTEIDAASNNGVDNIRELREEAGFTPVHTKYRVYIIDEVHMLSTGAFNALLKIMEEPPAHVLFILATTELHKVPATILSRCQRFAFHRIAAETIADRLCYIAGEENISLTREAAQMIASLSDGGMRDALSLLDLCIGEEGEITPQVVTACAGLMEQGYLFDIAQAAQNGDSAAALAVLEQLWEKAIDYQRLCEQLIAHYRNLMVVKAVKKPDELVPCLPDELERYKVQAGGMEMPQIMSCLNILQDTLGRISKTPARRTELEMGLIRLCIPGTDFAGLAARVEKLEHAVKAGVRPASEPQAKPQSAGSAAASQPEVKKASIAAPTRSEIEKTKVTPFVRWGEVLDVIREKNKALYGTMVDSSAYSGGDFLLVDAGDGMFSRMMKGDTYAKETLRDAVFAVTGQKYRLGSYNAEKYEVKPASVDALGDILQKAAQLGVDVQVKE